MKLVLQEMTSKPNMNMQALKVYFSVGTKIMRSGKEELSRKTLFHVTNSNNGKSNLILSQ